MGIERSATPFVAGSFAIVALLLLVHFPADAEEIFRWTDESGTVHYSDNAGLASQKGGQKADKLRMERPPPAKKLSEGEGEPEAARVPAKTPSTVLKEPPSPGLQKGNVPPDASFVALDGVAYRLKGLRGKVVFLNFWATWCGTCRREMPSMQKLFNQMDSRNFAMVAVTKEERGVVENFIRNNAYSFPVAIDDEDQQKTKFGVNQWPTTFILSKEGTILYSVVGGLDWNDSKMIQWFKYITSK